MKKIKIKKGKCSFCGNFEIRNGPNKKLTPIYKGWSDTLIKWICNNCEAGLITYDNEFENE